MKGDVIYEAWRRDENNRKFHVAAARTREACEAEVEEYKKRVAKVGGKVRCPWIDETVVATDFVIPSRSMPRERYRVETENRNPGGWSKTHVKVFEGERFITEYDRNYSMLGTFEPFRQGDRDFALVSPDYTATTVIDLATGEQVASEKPDTWGFCPVGFYVPDWWDVHDGTIIPGSHYWDSSDEWPVGDFGFVWGCVWGDDSSWKVQYLDLSKIAEGRIVRDDRFGYVELAAISANPKDFIRVWGKDRVRFAVEMSFDLHTGKGTDSGINF